MRKIFNPKAVVIHLFLLVCFSNGFSRSRRPNLDFFDQPRLAICIADSLQKAGEYDPSVLILERLLIRAVKGRDLKLQYECLNRLGLLEWNLGRMDDSEAFYKNALKISGILQNRPEKQRIERILEIFKYYRLGKQSRNQNNIEESKAHFLRAVDIARSIDSPPHELKCLRQLSLGYWQTRDFDEFLYLNQRALEIAERLCHRLEIRRMQNNLGVYYWKIKRYAQSLFYLDSALSGRGFSDPQPIDTDVLNNIGVLYKDLGLHHRALSALTKSLEITLQTGDQFEIASSYLNLGTLYSVLAEKVPLNGARALDCFFHCYNIAGQNGYVDLDIMCLNDVGMLYLRLKKPAEALKFFKIALKKAEYHRRINSEITIRMNIGHAYLMRHDYDQARKFYSAAVDSGYDKPDVILWEAFYGIGRCCEYEGFLDDSIENYKKSISLIEGMRDQLVVDENYAAFIRDKVEVYESVIRALYKKSLIKKADETRRRMYSFSEQYSARVFYESLRKAGSEIYGAGYDERDDKRSDSGFAVSRQSLARIQERLDSDTALFKYSIGEHMSFLFVILKDRFDVIELPCREYLKKSIKAYVKIISNKNKVRNGIYLASNRIYREIFSEGLERLPDSVSKIVIVPSDLLYFFPFESLNLSESRNSPVFLIEEYEISYVPSASAFQLTEGRQVGEFQYEFLGVGNPSENGRGAGGSVRTDSIQFGIFRDKGFDIHPIPNSEKEINRIAEYFDESRYVKLLNHNALESRIKSMDLTKFRIIHFACHSMIDKVDPYQSALILTAGEEDDEDGCLYGYEILGLDLHSELVVLSACQTGQGLLELGEGVIGLTRIFFYSGASSILSTLWQIEDKSAAEFMSLFYDFLRRNRSKSEALRQAKLRFIRSKYSNPYFWAAYVLNGDTNRLNGRGNKTFN